MRYKGEYKKFSAKSRTAQLIFQSFYCAFALVGFTGSIGLFDMKFSSDFYIYFTNISNYLCGAVMLTELLVTIRRQDDSYIAIVPRLKFISLLGIMLTFLVFNLLLANQPTRDPILNFTPSCILYHIVLPLMYLIDWLVFYEHGKTKWNLVLLSVLYPLAYLCYLFAHAALMQFDTSIMNSTGTDPLIYPYFFLNPGKVGMSGMFLWFLLLLVAFVLGSFIFILIDHLIYRSYSAKKIQSKREYTL